MTEHILRAAAERISGLSEEEIGELMVSPDWGSHGGLYDWKDYVAQSVKDAWDQLGMEAKLVAFIQASHYTFDA